MAITIAANSVYAYTDSNGVLANVQATNFTNEGDWSSATTYQPNDVVTYLGALYISFTTNLNTPPSGNVSSDWSTLVLVVESSGSVSGILVHVTADGAGVSP